MRKRITYLIFSLVSVFINWPLSAQICDGNLGDNIFDAGDFGSGTSNVLQNNPNIAPGYSYTTSPPPVDGLYVLTNNTGNWGNNFGTWLDIPDNSSDPNGYMMVVNASFEPGLFYEQEIDDLCENTLYQFSADVINLIRANVSDHIKPNVSFLIDGIQQYTSGDIPQNEQWNTYGFTFTTDPGQTSITLSLSNNAPGGIGNDLAIDNITFQPCGPLAQILPNEIESICEDGMSTELVATVTGDQYDSPAFQWQQSFDEGMTWVDIPGANGMTYTHTDLSSGFYYYRYLLANGPMNLSNSKCRVVSNVKIVEVVPKFWNIIDTLCEGLTYFTGGSTYTQTGIYIDSLISSIGCDSIVTLDLTFLTDPGIDANVSVLNPVCFGIPEGSIFIENIINGNPPYLISINGEEGFAGPEIPNLLSGMYDVVVTDVYGCTFEEVADIASPLEFTIELGEDQIIQLGDPVNIDPVFTGSINSFTWTPDVLDCEPNCLNFEFFPANSGDYVLTAISDAGCVAEDSVYIEVQKIRKVFIPNVFSPNFDGTNDYFAPFGDIPNVQSIQKMQVFNRWGAVVYEQSDFIPNEATNGWDGTFKGKEVETGVYIYLIEVEFLDGEVLSYSGSITVIK